MSAFFDESESGQYFTVGGYLFRKSKVRPFEREWGRMLKSAQIPYFRMSACNAGEYPFDKMDWEERDKVAREAIRIIIKFASAGYFVAVRPKEFDAILGKDSFVDNPYTLCLYLCLMGLQLWANEHDPTALFGYFFEAGCNHQGDAERFVKAIGLTERGPNFRYSGHSFVLKDRSMPTQAADVLAWHSSKNLNRYDQGIKEGKEHLLRPRGDFRALLDGVLTGYVYAEVALLNEFLKVTQKYAGDDHHLAKAAFRDDMRAFMKDADAVQRLIERQDKEAKR
jgi:hypothetical protein